MGRMGVYASMRTFLIASIFAAVMGPAGAQDRTNLQRIVVTDFFNTSKERHSIMIRSAADALAIELTKAGAYEVVARQEIDRKATKMRMTGQMREEDFTAIAKEVAAPLLAIGEIRYVEWRTKGKDREVEVGVVVRAK